MDGNGFTFPVIFEGVANIERLKLAFFHVWCVTFESKRLELGKDVGVKRGIKQFGIDWQLFDRNFS